MKQVMTVAIGNKSFTIVNEAYDALKDYLEAFRTKSSLGLQSEDTMQDIEERIAEIFSYKTGPVKNVVDMQMVQEVIDQLGMPDGQPYRKSSSANSEAFSAPAEDTPARRLYRSADERSIAGVCTGLGYYFNIDPVLLKILFVFLFIAGLSGLLIYIILWIIIPKAVTPAQKCLMRGLPLTADNIAKFSNKR